MSFDPGLWRGRVPEFTRQEKLPPAQIEQLAVNTDTDLLATWWKQGGGGQNYWRVNVPAKYLQGASLFLKYADLRRNGPTIVMPRQRGNVAIWPYAANATRGIIMAGMKQAGFRVLIEVDDNYLITTTHQQRLIAAGVSDWSNELQGDLSSTAAHKRLVRFVDGIIVTTETLAAAYREVHDHVYVCRNSIDPSDWPVPEKPTDGVFRVGYAASSSHLYDVADVNRALGWAAEQPNVEVLIYGLRGVEPTFRHTRVPWTDDLAEYRRSLALLDVGVCPLRPSPWADCKSDVKLMEYALAGAASVISRTAPYAEWHDTDMALTADTPKDFLKHIKFLVRNQDASREMAERAKARILAERTIETEIDRWRHACQSPS